MDAGGGFGPHHLLAVLFPGRAQALGDRSRSRAHPNRGDDDAGIDVVGAVDDVSAPLQGLGDRWGDHRDHERYRASYPACDAALWRHHCADAHRIWCGTIYPVATVSIQNAVPAHQVGTATGGMNFFRAVSGPL